MNKEYLAKILNQEEVYVMNQIFLKYSQIFEKILGVFRKSNVK